ncbi:hypothetical protein Poli38472_011793 [Pythium oligandrum]|uniref:ABC transmembrane type-1 domain-containing protein n=1 Tax=Pythium oligandrum TaxID=41045 RepID=A0A8K1C8G4_PYTOL|nr:hypothetical protein Poli38472_011793 [Pythium oligandrum]|eukprot:TMW58205.1 hypothetical protein Poli38472_011793 [Pythium oligandrum]
MTKRNDESVAVFHALETPRSDCHEPPLDDSHHPLDCANWLSVVTLWWIHPLLKRGYKEPLEETSVWPLATADQAHGLQERFDAAWRKAGEKKRPSWQFVRALASTTSGTMTLAVLLLLSSASFSLFQPMVIKAIIRFLQDQDNMFGIDSGYPLAVLLGATSFGFATANNFGMFLTMRAGCNARMVIVNTVYQKILRLSATARRTMNSGEVITLASVDSERILEAYMIGLWTVISPTMLVGLCILLGSQMNVYVGLAAAGAIVLIMYQAVTTSRAIGQFRRRISKLSAERVKVTNEVLQGIRVIKFYGWEDAIQEKI